MVDLEFELIWPNFPSFELHSVVYHKLFGGARGRYSAAVRCSQRRFWRFDDDTLCREVVGDVSRLCPRQIVLAFYEAGEEKSKGSSAAPGDAGGPESERASSAPAAVPSAAPGAEGLEGSPSPGGGDDVAMNDVCTGMSRLKASADSPVSPPSGGPSLRTLRRTKSFHGNPAELQRGGMEVLRTLFEGMAVSDAAADSTFVARGVPGPVGVPRGGPEESEEEKDALARTGGGRRGRRGRRGRGAGRDLGRGGAGRGEGPTLGEERRALPDLRRRPLGLARADCAAWISPTLRETLLEAELDEGVLRVEISVVAVEMVVDRAVVEACPWEAERRDVEVGSGPCWCIP